MSRCKFTTMLRLISAAIALLWAMVTGIQAQNVGTIKGNGPSSGDPKPSVCKPGQMLCIKSDDRWAAAINNANRRAENIRKNGVPKTKKGGQ